MDPEFWHSRWHEQRIGFHQDRPTPLLVEHWPSLGLAPDARVFVPLCGKSLDMAWLAARGHRVLGVELSPIAAAQFFDEHGLRPAITTSASGTHYAAGGIEIVCGDVFDVEPALLEACDAVFDRAALIALPADVRARYARGPYARLRAGCRGLLVTLEYPQHEKHGPPFSVPAAEVDALFAGDWRITALARHDILDAQPSFVAEGVTSLATAAYRIERR